MCRPVLLMLMSLFFACAPHRYYEHYHDVPTALREDVRSDLVIDLAAALASGRIRSLRVVTGDGAIQVHPPAPGAPRQLLDTLPLAVLETAWMALQGDLRGAEWDRVAVTQSGLVPVTVWFEPDRAMTLSLGRAMPDLAPGASRENVAQRHGLGPLVDLDASFSVSDLRALDHALSLLSTSERQLLQGTAIARVHGPGGEDDFWEMGSYARTGMCAAIRLFDGAFQRDDQEFHGEVDAPHPCSSMTILHEVGHRIVDLPSLRLEVEAAHLEERIEALSRQRDEMQGRIQAAKGPEAGRLSGVAAPILGQLGAALKRRDALKREQVAVSRRSPVLAEYLRRRGRVKGPTEFGRTDEEESFADSFALFRVDPAALRRVYPAVYEWFTAGGHLDAALGPGAGRGGSSCAPLPP